MLKDLTLGQFFPGTSPIHRLDPRIKLVLTVLIAILVFFVGTFVGYAILAGFILAVAVMSKLPLGYLFKGLKPLWLLVVFTFILNTLTTPGETVWWSWWVLQLTPDGLYRAIFFALRMLFLVFTTSLLTLTTSPIALTDAMEQLFKPLTIIRFPVHEMSMMMSLALHLIPILLEETDKIMKAQKARGADFESGNLFQRARSLVPLLVPLFLSAFRRAEDLAMAMEARCYRGGEGRTRMKVLRTNPKDWIAVGCTCVIVALVLADFIWKPLL